MMNEMKSPYYRLQQYYSVIEESKQSVVYGSEGLGVKLNDFATRLKLPIEVVRADVLCILESSGGDFLLKLEGKDDFGQYSVDKEVRKKFRKDLFAGIYDEANLERIIDDSRVTLPLTGEESSIMEEVLHFHYQPRTKKLLPFLIKDSYHFFVQDEKAMNDDLYNIRSCIEDKKEAIVLDCSSEIDKEIIIKPVSLFYDSTVNLYAVIYLTDIGLAAIRVDKIKFKREGEKYNAPKDINKRMKMIPNVWGLDFDAKPINVRVRINRTHSRGNVEKSVRKDLERRVNGKLTEEGDFLIYEDKVYGKDAFIRWLFSYGSSVVLEKPASLRKEIINILKKEVEKMK